MKKYSYPAVFTPEENGAYSIYFPDFESCYTCGDSLADGIMMAEDVLAFTLYDYEKENRPVQGHDQRLRVFMMQSLDKLEHAVCHILGFVVIEQII